jgi:hypothetical protein
MIRPGARQEQGHPGLGQGGDDQGGDDQGGDDQGERGQEQAQAGQHDAAAADPRQRDLGDGPDREQKEHDGSLDGVIILMQHASDEAGYQRTEQPEQGERDERGNGGGGELAPAPLGDAQPGETQGRPRAGADGLLAAGQETIWVQMATVGAEWTARLASIADARGVVFRQLISCAEYAKPVTSR